MTFVQFSKSAGASGFCLRYKQSLVGLRRFGGAAGCAFLLLAEWRDFQSIHGCSFSFLKTYSSRKFD
jgi:hypothetical protein